MAKEAAMIPLVIILFSSSGMISLFLTSKIPNKQYVFSLDKCYSMSKRHSISIDINVYERLRSIGRFGESHTDVISRLLNQVGSRTTDGYNRKVKGDDQT